MLSIMPTSVRRFRQKATKKARAKLHSFLYLTPPSPGMKTGKEISEKELYFSSSIDLDDLVSSLDEGGKQISPELHPTPIRKAITLQASVCKHLYPVFSQSRAHRDYVRGAYTRPLCPHCDIAAPSTLSSCSSSEEQETEGKTATITATDCGHPITVRPRTAAIIAANPLIFSPSPDNDDDDDEDSDKEERSHNNDVWPGLYTRCSSPHSLTLPPHERKPVRVNLNVRRCVACLKREQASALSLVARARAELRRMDDANIDDDTQLDRAAAIRYHELEELWAGRVSYWRRKCVRLRLGLEVLEQERERAEGEGGREERWEGGVNERRPRVNDDASTKKRRESTGNLRNLKSLSARSARSVSWRGARGEKWRDSSALKPALKKSTKADFDTESVVKKGLSVHFDSKSGAFGSESRSPARFERKSTYYRPGKWARDGQLLDTSGFSLTTEKEIKDWHSPPNGFTVSPENGEKVEKTREKAKRIVEKSQALGWL